MVSCTIPIATSLLFLSHLAGLVQPAACGSVSPRAACTPTTSTPGRPTKFGFLLFPGIEILDVAGPASALNMLSRRQKPQLELITIAADSGKVSTNSSVPFYETFIATKSIRSKEARNLDVLLVPGGPGTRVIDPAIVDYIRDVYPCLQYLLVVCTGSGLVAKSGILDGKKATSNKLAWKWATAQGPNVNWVRDARWVVDGNIWTSSGVSAGLDSTFAWIKEIYGETESLAIANILEYERHTDASWDPFSDVFNSTKLP